MQLCRRLCAGERAEAGRLRAAAGGRGQGRENQPNVQEGQPTGASSTILSFLATLKRAVERGCLHQG